MKSGLAWRVAALQQRDSAGTRTKARNQTPLPQVLISYLLRISLKNASRRNMLAIT